MIVGPCRGFSKKARHCANGVLLARRPDPKRGEFALARTTESMQSRLAAAQREVSRDDVLENANAIRTLIIAGKSIGLTCLDDLGDCAIGRELQAMRTHSDSRLTFHLDRLEFEGRASDCRSLKLAARAAQLPNEERLMRFAREDFEIPLPACA